jgi:hypothetical protein
VALFRRTSTEKKIGIQEIQRLNTFPPETRTNNHIQTYVDQGHSGQAVRVQRVPHVLERSPKIPAAGGIRLDHLNYVEAGAEYLRGSLDRKN